MTAAYVLFETAFGCAAIAFGPRGVLAVSFPSTEDDARRRILRHANDAKEKAPDTEIAALIDDIAASFRGEPRDFSAARLDLGGVGDFERRVYGQTRAIPIGAVSTYGEIARALGDVALSQRVGQALGRNPFPVIVPCHRVIGADGRMTGFSAQGGTSAKRRLLRLEGALAPDLFDSAAP
ncbi:MAG: methylated-DNA--[protein]-cysteine S-methyltransferase [Parvularculaceae bacterium]|jgi:methylated-DNA-[protein]-cysteine S-methyltransferase|nr:methylated-DNA--[protein]-cysteine S-methyltransferase [Parvularculaceae bacterium]